MEYEFKSNYHFFNEELSKNFCHRVENYVDTLTLEKGKVGHENNFSENDNVRRAYVYIYDFVNAKDGIEREICLEFFRMCTIVNNKDWNFKIHDVNFTIQLTQYTDKDEGTYDWHQDDPILKKGNYRKISMSSVVKECDEGGEFMLDGECSGFDQKVGSVIVFPSFLNHKVTPVTKGKRISIVGWFYGPEWS